MHLRIKFWKSEETMPWEIHLRKLRIFFTFCQGFGIIYKGEKINCHEILFMVEYRHIWWWSVPGCNIVVYIWGFFVPPQILLETHTSYVYTITSFVIFYVFEFFCVFWIFWIFFRFYRIFEEFHELLTNFWDLQICTQF